MNFRNVSQNYRISRFSLIIFISTLVFIFLLYSLCHNWLFNVSINVLYTFYSNSSSSLILFFGYVNKLFNMNLIFIILLIFYNSANVYKSFILLCEIIITKYIAGLLKLIYLHPKPAFNSRLNEYQVFINNNIDPYWGYPNESLLLYPLFYLSLWRILTKRLVKTNMQVKIKIFLLCLVISILFFYALSEFVLCNASIDQILFSIMISLSFYFFIFYAGKINFSDNRQFYKIIKYSFKKLSLCVFLLLSISTIIFCIRTYSENGKNILNEYNNFTNSTINTLSFNKEAFASCFILISICSLLLGCRTEIRNVFMEQFTNWTQFNFEPNDDNIHSSGDSFDSSLSERISITKTAQWNHTNAIISLGRILLIGILVFLCFLPGMFIGWDWNFGVVLIIKIGLCWGLLTSGVTLWFKIITRLCGLTNTTLWNMIRESV